jgi:hypothetical protein
LPIRGSHIFKSDLDKNKMIPLKEEITKKEKRSMMLYKSRRNSRNQKA